MWFKTYGPKKPWFWTIAIYFREKWRPYFGRSNSDLEVFFFRIFKFSPIKLVMLDPQNTKNATSLHVFRAMFDPKGLGPFRVQKFGLFLIGVKN